ncbi:hypothetical protein [Paenibacillus monticola]|uniref:Uncharacterized protein n=1 Tax=Paenibacillus monticola TaxID=2666075 RepID=A0A7X2HAZ8_9BACL|nr:hypothetical protein [Paenibacillus monticola]MRN56088.1 hypothetical protein [Paenibacillus monticola]
MELDIFYQSITEQERNTFSELAHAAMLLGYKPKKAKTQAVNYVFVNNRTKHHIMKFSIEKGKPILKLKFYASTEYSNLFQEGVRTTIEEYNYKYTGCYHCGKCTDELKGYVYKYNDGRTYFRCGGELISLPPISQNDIPEIIKLLERQHEYYLYKEG